MLAFGFRLNVWPYVALIASLLLSAPMRAQLLDSAPARLGGTFLQLLDKHQGWTPAQWDSLFAYLRRLGVAQLVVQWSAYDESRFYAASQPGRPSLLEHILHRADNARIRVWVGLHYDSGFWVAVNRDPTLVRVTLQRASNKLEEIARELRPLMEGHRSVAGWYILQEIDDTNWRDPLAEEVLVEYLTRVVAHLRATSPVKSIAISGFSNARLSPRQLAAFWGRVLAAAPVDILMFQDGVGADRIPPHEVATYLKLLRRSAEAAGTELQVVVELFQTSSTKGSAFQAGPAPLDRVQRQLQVAGRHSMLPALAFSMLEYMTPLGGPRAAQLYHDYLAAFEPHKLPTAGTTHGTAGPRLDVP